MTLDGAMQQCHPRGYIVRAARPERKFWKVMLYFDLLPKLLAAEDVEAGDWETNDPEPEPVVVG